MAILFSLEISARSLQLDSSTEDMLSEKLEFRKVHQEFRQAFPILARNIVVVVESANSDRSQDGAEALSELLKKAEREPSSAIRSVFSVDHHPFFRRHGLLYLDPEELEDLADRLAQAQPMLGQIMAAPNLGGFFTAVELSLEEDDPPPAVDDLLRRLSDAAAAIEDGDAQFSWNALLSPEEQEDVDRRFILVRPNLDYSSLRPAGKAIATIRDAAAGIKESYGVEVRLTGGVALEEEEFDSVFQSVRTAAILSFLLVSLIIVWALGSIRLITAALITLLAGLILTLGFATLSVGRLNLISAAFAVLYIGLGIDFILQFSLRCREQAARTSKDPAALIEAAAQGVALPILLAGIAAMIGFLSFLATDYVGLAELGIIAAGGMAIAVLSTFTLLPALIRLFGGAPPGKKPLGPTLSLPFSLPLPRRWPLPLPRRWPLAHPRWVIGGTVILLGIAGPLSSQLRFDADPIRLKDPSSESVQTAYDIRRSSPLSEYSAAVLADDAGAARDLARRLEALESVDRTVSIDDWLPRHQEEKKAWIDDIGFFLLPTLIAPPTAGEVDRRAATEDLRRALRQRLDEAGPHTILGPRIAVLLNHLDRLLESPDRENHLRRLEEVLLNGMPGRIERLAQALEPESRISLESLPEEIRRRIISPQGRVLIQVYAASPLETPRQLEEFVSQTRTVAPLATDTPIIIHEAGRAVLDAFVRAGTLAILLNMLLVRLALGRWGHTLLVFAPLLCAAVVSGGTAVLFGIDLNFANLIALPLLFSLGISYGIYIVLRSRALGDVATMMASSTPEAIFFSAATTIASFSSLMIASHAGIAGMGALLTIALLFATLFTLILLPVLLLPRLDRR